MNAPRAAKCCAKAAGAAAIRGLYLVYPPGIRRECRARGLPPEVPFMDDKPNSQAARDIAYYFHPATNARRHEEIGPTIMERGKGVHVYDDQGKEYIEGLAGLWSVAVGFGEERLVRAATPPDAEAALLPLVQPQIAPGRDRPRRAPRQDGAEGPRQGAVHEFGLGGERLRHQAPLVLQQRHRPSAEEEIHLAPARLSRRDDRGREPHGPARSISAISTCRCR